MYKLKNTYIDKLIEKKVSKGELAFLLYIAQYQDDYGTVHSVYYKDVCNAISISTQKFYDILHSLTQKNLIFYEKENPADFKVHLNGNNFEHKNFQEGYINVAEKDFSCPLFVSMKAGSQLLYLYSQRFIEGKHMLLQKFYDDFCRLFDVTRKTLQLYVQELKDRKYLFISKKRNKAYHYEMTMKRSTCLNKKGIIPREKEGYFENIKRLVTINFKKYIDLDSESDKKTLRDIANLAEAKRAEQIRNFPSLIVKAVRDSLKLQKEENKKELKLNAALVNRCLTSRLNG